MARAGVHGGTDQDRFSGRWDAGTLHHHDQKNRAIPVVHKVLSECSIKEIHA
jgi:hypothetical protein